MSRKPHIVRALPRGCQRPGIVYTARRERTARRSPRAPVPNRQSIIATNFWSVRTEQHNEVVAEYRNDELIRPPLLIAGILEDRGRREKVWFIYGHGERDEATVVDLQP